MNAGERRSSRAAMRRSARNVDHEAVSGLSASVQVPERGNRFAENPERAAIALFDEVADDVRARRRAAEIARGARRGNAKITCRLESDVEAGRHATEGFERGLERALAGRGDGVAARPSSAALRRRRADVRRDEPFVLEAAERFVNRPQRQIASRATLDLVVDGNAIRVLADAQHARGGRLVRAHRACRTWFVRQCLEYARSLPDTQPTWDERSARRRQPDRFPHRAVQRLGVKRLLDERHVRAPDDAPLQLTHVARDDRDRHASDTSRESDTTRSIPFMPGIVTSDSTMSISSLRSSNRSSASTPLVAVSTVNPPASNILVIVWRVGVLDRPPPTRSCQRRPASLRALSFSLRRDSTCRMTLRPRPAQGL